MKLGIGSYTYVWAVGVAGCPPPAEPLSALALVSKAAEVRVPVVQIADNLPLHRLTGGERTALRDRAATLGVELEAGTAGIEPENLRRYLAIARELGARILRTVIDAGADRPSPGEAVARLAPLVPEFERAGVTLAIENHDRFKAATLRDIVKALGSANVGVCLDTANSLGCLEGPEHVVETLGPQVVNLHVKDVRVFRPPHHKGFVVEGAPAGAGQLDLPRLLARLREFGVDPSAIVELWPPPEDDVAQAVKKEELWARQSLDYLRPLLVT
ncbi:MAG TPA: sugar phosphate isomerase/epimerase family protein [Opitutus sp.]|nr:sugar phosphate isomerase/epimerase family protein [Opitutus sp.]